MENDFQQNIEAPTFSIFIRFLAIIVAVVIGALIGSACLLGLAILGGAEINTQEDIFNSLSDPNLRPYLKAGIGINHFFTFSFSALLFALWINRGRWLSYFWTKKTDFILLILFTFLLFCAYPMIGAAAMLLEYIPLPEWANSMDESSIDALMKVLKMNNIFDLFVNLLVIAVLPAIGEELLFRGVIQRELHKTIKNPHIAILIAAIIFSAVHLQVQGFLPKMIIGLILGYAYYFTKSLWIPIILHFLNNGVNTVVLYFSADALENMDLEEATEPSLAYIVVGVIISSFLCYLIIKSIRERLSDLKIQNE